MSTWMEQLTNILTALTASKGQEGEAPILFAIGVLALIIAVSVVAPRFGFKFTPWTRVIVIVFTGLVLSLLGVVLVRVYAVPAIASNALGLTLQILVPMVVCLAVVMPMMCFMFKGSYVDALITTILSVLLTVIAVIAVRGAWHAVSDNKSLMEIEKDRQEAMKIELLK